jgi:hypothetical protein
VGAGFPRPQVDVKQYYFPINNGTINRATMFTTLIIGLMAQRMGDQKRKYHPTNALLMTISIRMPCLED